MHKYLHTHVYMETCLQHTFIHPGEFIGEDISSEQTTGFGTAGPRTKEPTVSIV